jgi:tRNA pseudouridine55 synthase
MIGERLGFPAHMSYLQRIQSASFKLEDCLTFEDIERHIEKGTISEVLRPLEMALSHLPKLCINDKVAEKVKNGALLHTPDHLQTINGPIIAETDDGTALAIYAKHPNKPDLLKPVKVLRNEIE